MKTYSQGQEQDKILEYFREYDYGTFLDIGAYHPETFSNVRGLYELGWKGVLIEPAKENFENIRDYYIRDKEIEVVNTCIGDYDGEIEFFDSQGDAIGTTDKSHRDLWAKNYGVPYQSTTASIMTIETLLSKTDYETFDFINIDTEGTNYEILITIPLHRLGCKMLCVEWNSKDFTKYNTYMTNQGYRLIFKNAENLIYVL